MVARPFERVRRAGAGGLRRFEFEAAMSTAYFRTLVEPDYSKNVRPQCSENTPKGAHERVEIQRAPCDRDGSRDTRRWDHVGQVDDVRPRCVKRTSDGDNGHDVNNDDINDDDDINNHPDHHDDCLGIHSDGDHLGTSDVGSRCDEYTEHGTRHNEGVDNVILNYCTAHYNDHDNAHYNDNDHDDDGAAHHNDNDNDNDHDNDNDDDDDDDGAAHHLFGYVQRQYEWRWGSAV